MYLGFVVHGHGFVGTEIASKLVFQLHFLDLLVSNLLLHVTFESV